MIRSAISQLLVGSPALAPSEILTVLVLAWWKSGLSGGSIDTYAGTQIPVLRADYGYTVAARDSALIKAVLKRRPAVPIGTRIRAFSYSELEAWIAHAAPPMHVADAIRLAYLGSARATSATSTRTGDLVEQNGHFQVKFVVDKIRLPGEAPWIALGPTSGPAVCLRKYATPLVSAYDTTPWEERPTLFPSTTLGEIYAVRIARALRHASCSVVAATAGGELAARRAGHTLTTAAGRYWAAPAAEEVAAFAALAKFEDDLESDRLSDTEPMEPSTALKKLLTGRPVKPARRTLRDE